MGRARSGKIKMRKILKLDHKENEKREVSPILNLLVGSVWGDPVWLKKENWDIEWHSCSLCHCQVQRNQVKK